jgi:hypothetical protein
LYQPISVYAPLKTDFAEYSIIPEKSFLALEYSLTKELLTGILKIATDLVS